MFRGVFCVNINVNNSLFLKNIPMGISQPNLFHSALNLAAILCWDVQMCIWKKTHRENYRTITQPETATCPVPSHISRTFLCCSTQHTVLHSTKLSRRTALLSPVMCYKSSKSGKALWDLSRGTQETGQKWEVVYMRNKFCWEILAFILCCSRCLLRHQPDKILFCLPCYKTAVRSTSRSCDVCEILWGFGKRHSEMPGICLLGPHIW